VKIWFQNFAFECNLYRYTWVAGSAGGWAGWGAWAGGGGGRRRGINKFGTGMFKVGLYKLHSSLPIHSLEAPGFNP
jgi:hypothetical protein